MSRFIRLTRQSDGSPVLLRADTITVIARGDLRPLAHTDAGLVRVGDRPEWSTIVGTEIGASWVVNESIDDVHALIEGRPTRLDDPPEVAIR